MNAPILRILTLLLPLLLTPFYPGWAVFDPVNDDTDLFLSNPNVASDRPNVLIILDNTANWNQPFVNEKSALVSVVANLSELYNVGLMMFPETGNPNDNVDGGYVRFAVRQMTSTNKSVLADMVNTLHILNDKGNNATTGLAMYEAFLYYSGAASRAGFGKIKTDFANNAANNPASAHGLGSHALPAAPTAASLYNAPIANGCQKNFIIYISNGPASENASARRVSEDKLAELTRTTSPAIIAISPSGQQGNWADEWANYLANSDVNSQIEHTQSVYTYVVEVDPTSTGQGPDMTALLKSMANKGQGRYFAVSSGNAGQAIINAMNEIFQEIQAVNSVFAATTLPVSVNVRGTNLNQVYVGMFRPDSNKLPRWYGNLKCYQLGYESATDDLFLADRNGVKAENTTTGFLTPDAASFWTQSSDFWTFRDSSANGAGGSSDLPDGDLVEKGGAAQMLRIDHATSQAARNLYTCTGSCASGDLLSLFPFQTTNSDITATALMLDVHTVSTLTGEQERPVTTLTDILSVVSLSTAAGSVGVTSLDNGSVTKNVSALTTTQTHTITNLTNSPVTQSVSLITRPSNGTAEATLNNHGYSTGQTVTIAAATCNSRYSGTFTITVADSNKFRYTIANGSAANCTAATATTTSSLVTASAASHGFVTGQSVTIAGASPTGFNGTYTITVGSANAFTFSSVAPLGVPTAFGTASGQTSTATATVTAHGYAAGDLVTIAGATPSGYNGNVTILSTPTANTFTYAASPLANATGTLTVTRGSTTVTATTAAAHGFATGNTITIQGATPTDYNGSHTITVTSATSFTYATPTVLPPQTGSGITASSGVSTTATAVIAAHGLFTGDTVTIAGATPTDYNGSFVITRISADAFSYALTSSPAPATGTITARLTTPTALATLAGHGFATGQTITIRGVNQADYNGLFSITATDADHFRYPLAAAPMQAATGTPLAVTPSTTAQATAIAHGFADNAQVAISGASPAAFNGTFTISRIDDNHFTYTLPSAQAVASGDISAEDTAGGTTTSARESLIHWVRGEDNFEDENQNTSSTDIRASVHADVLHSKPAVINYNRLGTDNDVMVYYGANDGIFRAIKGGFTSEAGEPEPGREVWGFIPPEFFGQLKRLRNNDPILSSASKKPYFADGTIGSYVLDANSDGKLRAEDGDKVHLFIGMRRGGRLLYALDVTTPEAPRLLWKKDRTSTGFQELGYTWSEPKVISRINANSGNPVLVFGAGYDPTVEDVTPESIVTAVSSTSVTTSTAVYTRSMGRGIFVLDAATGEPLWQAGPGREPGDTGTHPYLTVSGMHYAIPSDVTVITHNGGTIPNRAYVGDAGGNLWRVNLNDADPANWSVTRLAAIGDLTDIPGGLRKFLYPPDVVYASGYDAVLIGSGDREHPLDVSVHNRMYMFKDTDIGTTSTDADIREGDLYDVTSNCIQDSSGCADGVTSTVAQSALDAARGWYFRLLEGEKVVSNPITINTVTFFNTHQAASTATNVSCVSSLGVARAYQVVFTNATAVKDRNQDNKKSASDRHQIHPGGGFLPPPTPVVVQIDGKTLTGVVSGVRVDEPPGVDFGTRYRRFWFKEME
nr:Putative type 4 fimbrial biogenesis protein [uncultured bacterium]